MEDDSDKERSEIRSSFDCECEPDDEGMDHNPKLQHEYPNYLSFLSNPKLVCIATMMMMVYMRNLMIVWLCDIKGHSLSKLFRPIKTR